ncbi:MAG: class I SAM-dependent methyltransferase [Gammaproteobacteria bacterium]|nr:class I SAM-dependent methyltransferase [Gammaproteobacteria bacterium]
MDITAFANRLRKNQRHWSKWARRRHISCYRIYDRDIPEFPLAIDWYEGRVHAQSYAHKGVEALNTDLETRLAEVIREVLEINTQHLSFKTRQRQKGLQQYAKTGSPGQPFIVQEAGLAFQVDLHRYLDTGLFLDHRVTRSLVRDKAAGKQVLNLFAYTGSFSVYAAAGHAQAVTSVDLSKTYLAWAQHNLQLNKLENERHRFIRSDVLSYLEQAKRESRRFGLIILDPPSFSNSKMTQRTLDVQRDQVRLISDCLSLLNQGGELIFSTNRRKFKADPELMARPSCSEITAQTLPEDFHRHRAHRCWLFQNS